MGISVGIMKQTFICAVHALLGSKYAIKIPQMVLSNFLVYHIDSGEYLENHSLSWNVVFIAHIGQTHYKSNLESLPPAARLWPHVCDALLNMYLVSFIYGSY